MAYSCQLLEGELLAGLVRGHSLIHQIYMQPVYLHVSRGLNGSQTGLLLLPSSVVGSISSLYAGWHMRVSTTCHKSKTIADSKALQGIQVVPIRCLAHSLASGPVHHRLLGTRHQQASLMGRNGSRCAGWRGGHHESLDVDGQLCRGEQF